MLSSKSTHSIRHLSDTFLRQVAFSSARFVLLSCQQASSPAVVCGKHSEMYLRRGGESRRKKLGWKTGSEDGRSGEGAEIVGVDNVSH